jgi:hypothetical protein
MSQNTEAIWFPAESAVQSFCGLGLSSCFHCMDCLFASGVWWWNQDLSPVNSLAGNPSGSLLWWASSTWQFCTLFFFVWAWDLLKPRVHKHSSFLNLCGLLHELLHDREMLPVTVYQWLHTCSPWCQRDTAQLTSLWAVGWWPGLISFLTVVCSLLQLPTHWNTLLWCGSFFTCGFLLTPLSSKTTIWYTFVLDITFHCPWQHTTDWHNHPVKTEPMASSATIYGVNVQCPLPRNVYISWMAKYFCGHVTSMSVDHLWMALVEQECWNLILYTFHAIVVHK